MAVLLSAHSVAQRRHRKQRATASSSTFSWIVFFIAVSTFTVWSLGVSTCTSSADQQQLFNYYRSEASNSKSFASVLLLLQELSTQLAHVLPAVIATLLLSHRYHSHLTGEPHPSSATRDIDEEGAHTAEVDCLETPQLIQLRRVLLLSGGNNTQSKKAAAAQSA